MPKKQQPRTGRDAGQGRANGQGVLPGFSIPDSRPVCNPSASIAKEQYRRRAQAIILRRVLRGEETNADHVHTLLPTPAGVNPKVLGTVFYGLARDGLIVMTRFAKSQRPQRHGGLYRTWRVADAKAARAYLTALVKSGDDITMTTYKGRPQ